MLGIKQVQFAFVLTLGSVHYSGSIETAYVFLFMNFNQVFYFILSTSFSSLVFRGQVFYRIR
jgi:hypothetical protein